MLFFHHTQKTNTHVPKFIRPIQKGIRQVGMNNQNIKSHLFLFRVFLSRYGKIRCGLFCIFPVTSSTICPATQTSLCDLLFLFPSSRPDPQAPPFLLRIMSPPRCFALFKQVRVFSFFLSGENNLFLWLIFLFPAKQYFIFFPTFFV